MNRAILLLVFITLMLNLSLLMGFLFRRRLRLRERIDQLGQYGRQQQQEYDIDPSILLGKDVKGGEYSSNFVTNFFTKKRQQLSQANILMKPEEFFFLSLAIAIILFLLIFLMTRLVFIGLVAGIIGYLLPGIYLSTKKDKRGAEINKQLPEALDLIASGLRAGLSFAQAMNLAAKDMEQPIRGEFEKVLRDNTLGKSMEDALLGLTYRTKDENIDLFVTAMIVQRQVGGNLAEVLEIISHTLRERVRLQGEIRTMTAQSRISGIVIGLLPPGLAVVLSVMNPGYMQPLFTEPLGIILLIVATVMTVMGAVILMRMSKVEV